MEYIPLSWLVVGQLILVMAVSHLILDRFVFRPLARACLRTDCKSKSAEISKSKTEVPPSPPITPEPSNNKDSLDGMTVMEWKFTSSCFKFTAHSVLFLIGVIALLQDNYLCTIFKTESADYQKGWLFTDGFIGNFREWPAMSPLIFNVTEKFWNQVPMFLRTFTLPAQIIESENILEAFSSIGSKSVHVASGIYLHYHWGMAHYIYTLLLMMFGLDGPKQKDRLEMTVHHVITITLMLMSWPWEFGRAGSVIMVLHDMSDPFMEVAKLMLYTGRQLLANIWFASFAIVFMASRCVVFPRSIVYVLIAYAFSDEGQEKAKILPMWYLPIVGLCLLQLLHLFWSTLIIKMIVNAFKQGGNVEDDIRDEVNEKVKTQ